MAACADGFNAVLTSSIIHADLSIPKSYFFIRNQFLELIEICGLIYTGRMASCDVEVGIHVAPYV